MANSNITKKALAQSLKELGSTKILDKITVADITNHCGVNRQTFYYHFQDIQMCNNMFLLLVLN